MKAFVTGATGFIGGRVARQLRERGDDVVCLVRSPAAAGALGELGCELVEGDLGSADTLERAMRGCDAAFHIAAIYKVGIPASQHAAMYEANVRGTERVLDAAVAAGVTRIVYISTCGVFGDTGGQLVDERYERPGPDFLSYYDETKYLAHRAAKERIAQGAPIVIVQPGGVYGPGDHSEVGDLLERANRGKLPAIALADTGMMLAHVDDIAHGILLAHDQGRLGESYVLAGTQATLRDAIEQAATVGGRKPPRVQLPNGFVKLIAPLGPVIGPLMGFPSNLNEAVRAGAGVTYWATDAKARSELGFAPRDLETGIRDTFATAA